MRLARYTSSTAVQRGVIAILAGIAVLAVPALLGRLLVWVVGAVAVAVGLGELWRAFHDRQRANLLRGLVFLAVGLAVLIGSDQFRRNLELFIAALLAFRAAHSTVDAWRSWRQEGEDPFWGMARGFLWISLAVALVLVPERLFSLVLFGIAISWILSAVVVVVNAIGHEDDNEVPDDLIGVIRSNSMAADLRRQVTDSIFEEWDSRAGTLRFAALMGFATAVATLGVKADSTAVVIGAMLIAPLMSPIMALSASILMGWPRRAEPETRSLSISWSRYGPGWISGSFASLPSIDSKLQTLLTPGGAPVASSRLSLTGSPRPPANGHPLYLLMSKK